MQCLLKLIITKESEAVKSFALNDKSTFYLKINSVFMISSVLLLMEFIV